MRITSPFHIVDQHFSGLGGTWRLLSACLALSMLSIWLVFAGIAYETYETAWRDANVFANDVEQLLENGIARDVEVYDLSLKALVENAANPELMALPSAIRRMALFNQAGNAPGMGAMLLVDKDGNVLLESKRQAPPPVNVRDRDYFIAQHDGTATSQPFVSHPLYSRITHVHSIVFSRPRLSPLGTFDGVVCGTMRIDYLAELFQSVHLPPDSTITMIHRDGTILARNPEIGIAGDGNRRAANLYAALQSGNAGSFVRPSTVDGVERLVAYHQVGTLPVYLAVGLSTAELIGNWRWRLEIVGLAFVALSAIILFLGIMLARELNRRTCAERTLSELAATDSLTLLANRRRFDEVSQVEWRRAIRDSAALSLIMLDGDFFKAFNDTYGHIEGDQALRLIADTLRRAVERPGDLVARFGGEEFVVLLPGTDREGANQIAEAIRQAVRDLALPHAGSTLGILTVSIGVASRWPRPQEGVATLIEAADAALYLAKADGRDRIVLDQGIAAARSA